MAQVRVLIIGAPGEELDTTRDALRSAEDIQATIAAGIETAEQIVAASRPDLVIIQETQSASTGISSYNQLRSAAAFTAIPVLLLFNSSPTIQERALALAAGIDMYLVQPVDSAELLMTTRALLRLYRAESSLNQALLAEQVARSNLEAAQDRLAFLSDASGLLSSSLDYETTLASLARLAVPRVADWCSIDILENSTLKLVEVSHSDPNKVRWARELRERMPIDMESSTGSAAVVRTGKSELYIEIDDAVLRAAARSEEELAILRQVGFRSAMTVPLLARGPNPVGVLTLVLSESNRSYTSVDLALAEELGRRAAYAIENSRIYHESQEALHARDIFLSVASHELKTPLTIIQGYAELLKKTVDRQSIRSGHGLSAVVTLNRDQLLRRVENVYEAAGRLTTLINELLDINRLQRGAFELNREKVDISALLGHVVQDALARDMASDHPRRIRVESDYAPGEVCGMWDRSRIEQVIVNLIDNAYKYSPDGETIQIVLRIEPGGASDARPADEEKQAHLTVTDHGIGILPEDRPHIFEPFIRGTNAAQRRVSGLGLGLAITREIVEHHGGEIWVESDGKDKGSVFHVTLPGVI